MLLIAGYRHSIRAIERRSLSFSSHNITIEAPPLSTTPLGLEVRNGINETLAGNGVSKETMIVEWNFAIARTFPLRRCRCQIQGGSSFS